MKRTVEKELLEKYYRKRFVVLYCTKGTVRKSLLKSQQQSHSNKAVLYRMTLQHRDLVFFDRNVQIVDRSWWSFWDPRIKMAECSVLMLSLNLMGHGIDEMVCRYMVTGQENVFSHFRCATRASVNFVLVHYNENFVKNTFSKNT